MCPKPWPNFDQNCGVCGTPCRVVGETTKSYESKYDYVVRAYAELMALLHKERTFHEEEVRILKKMLKEKIK